MNAQEAIIQALQETRNQGLDAAWNAAAQAVANIILLREQITSLQKELDELKKEPTHEADDSN